MSSSSLSSKNDLYNDTDDRDYFLSDALVGDIERFAGHAERLRKSLEPGANLPDGESMCVLVHSSLSVLSQSLRDLLIQYPGFKAATVLIAASELIHSVRDLNFDTSNVDASRTLSCLEKLEAAIGAILKHSLYQPTSSLKYSSASIVQKNKNNNNEEVRSNRLPTRRHSTFQAKGRDSAFTNFVEMDHMVASRLDGIEIAFERSKAWAKYCKDLLNYVSRRMQLELEHAKRLQNLANQSKISLSEHYLPLKDVFESSFENDIAFGEQTYEAVKHIQERFVKSLEMRRDEHERQRRALKNEWLRVTKQLRDTQQELQKARSHLASCDDGYRKAQENCMRTEMNGPAVGSELLRRRKELDRKRRNEEDALNKREDAQGSVERLELELERRQQQMEQTKALANLWVPQPGKYHEFAHATRSYIPGAEYTSFLKDLPRKTSSTGSLCRVDTLDGLSSSNHTASSSSTSSQRRNAIERINSSSHFEKKQKKSSVSLFGYPSTLEGINAAARSHCLQRVRQPAKCSHCEGLSLLSTLQCSRCGMSWHKSCIPKVSVSCEQSIRSGAESSRRTSIFGVSLYNHLSCQDRHVPIVLEYCVDELQKRGMKVKGLYRTCGVKSKIEQICEHFERSPTGVGIDLGAFHPMNIASVIKLYMRKLPEPLLTQELFEDWISMAENNLLEEQVTVADEIRAILHRLPAQNFGALQFLLLHLNRVTWFEAENLMTSSNLGAVISPSMMWKQMSAPASGNSAFLSNAHLMSRTVDLLIKYAFILFDVDVMNDRRVFQQKYSEMETVVANDGEFIDGEGLADDDLLEDDADPLCSVYAPQPPTPDLLKNTLRNKVENYSISDDVDFDNLSMSTGGSGCSVEQMNRSLKALALASYVVTGEQNATARQAGQRDKSETVSRMRSRSDKKRSFTTSILVSPRVERKFSAPSKQSSMDMERRTISARSGDVSVDDDATGFYLPTNLHDRRSSVRNSDDILSNLCQRLKEEMPPMSTGLCAAVRKISQVQSAGALFQTADTSYI